MIVVRFGADFLPVSFGSGPRWPAHDAPQALIGVCWRAGRPACRSLSFFAPVVVSGDAVL